MARSSQGRILGGGEVSEEIHQTSTEELPCVFISVLISIQDEQITQVLREPWEKKKRKKIVPGDHTGPRITPVSNSLSGIPRKECSMSQSPRTGLLHYHGIKIKSRLNGALVLPHKS